jgi:hypothetical protein
MNAKPPPKPNTQFLSWFYGENQKGSLILDPKYQRNPIWSMGQKCFLIDSLISGCPIPQVYINIRTHGTGTSRKTLYEVVDGQQRLRAILEFMGDDWALIKTAAKAYPVSGFYKPHIGKRYSELPNDVQEGIWNFPLAVQELREWGDAEIRSLFRRLNYVNEKLNKQELRHSQYFGEFIHAVEELAKDQFWDDVGLFSRRDFQRMRDIEFVSELFVVVIDGVQNGQESLDSFYADYDVVFRKRAFYVARFHNVLTSLKTVAETIAESRYSKRADFYGLFAATLRLNKSRDKTANLTSAKSALMGLARELDNRPEALTGAPAIYYATVSEGPNKLPKRKTRTNILYGILDEHVR